MDNSVILRQIFKHLPLNYLLTCSLVNKLWSIEARLFIRNHRECLLKIVSKSQCCDFKQFHNLVEGMTVIPFNGLEIRLKPHDDCVPVKDLNCHFNSLLDYFPLKHLSIILSKDVDTLVCPAPAVILQLMRERSGKLHTLRLHLTTSELQRLFQDGWMPNFPNLKEIEVPNSKLWTATGALLKRLFDGAPNLKVIRNRVETSMLECLPENKFNLISNFRFWVASMEMLETCEKLADKRPALMSFHVTSVFDDRLKYKFMSVLERLLASSRQSLKELNFISRVAPLHKLSCLPLVNLNRFTIEDFAFTQDVWEVIQRLDYPHVMPVLEEVFLQVYEGHVEKCQLEFNDRNAIALNASKTLSKLDLNLNVNFIDLVDLRRVFPSVTSLKIFTSLNHDRSYGLPYRKIWTLWPQLELFSASCQEMEVINCDAEFCGVNEEEIVALQAEDDEFLKSVHIVPIYPCMTTMLSLRSLHVNNTWRVDFGDKIQVFLSRVTEHLVFNRMPHVKIFATGVREDQEEQSD